MGLGHGQARLLGWHLSLHPQFREVRGHTRPPAPLVQPLTCKGAQDHERCPHGGDGDLSDGWFVQ